MHVSTHNDAQANQVQSMSGVPCEVVDASLRSIVPRNGGNGHDSIHRGHVDDAASSPRLHLVLLYHLPSCCLPRLQTRDLVSRSVGAHYCTALATVCPQAKQVGCYSAGYLLSTA